ncbi:MAG TPA: tetratricopeptide repeat protein, partial [Pyrinomonadaceae bacterium]|nr:tetratricopeptide repeat protein [Pyrinomonadaceae bacterium]
MVPTHLSCKLLALILTLSGCFQNLLAAQSETALELGKPIERQLSKDETHSYAIVLTTGQYGHLIVDQRGIDVAVAMYGPDGAKLVEVDSPNYNHGPEPLSFVADTAGTYRLEVRATSEITARYEVRLEQLRTATQEDRSSVAAQKLFAEAKELRDQRKSETYQQALEKYQAALNIWRALGDKMRQAFTLHNSGWIYGDTGQYQKALDCYAEAGALYKGLGDRRGEISILNNTAWIYGALGDNQKSLEMYLQ